jgi:hypothetical protein
MCKLHIFLSQIFGEKILYKYNVSCSLVVQGQVRNFLALDGAINIISEALVSMVLIQIVTGVSRVTVSKVTSSVETKPCPCEKKMEGDLHSEEILVHNIHYLFQGNGQASYTYSPAFQLFGT